MDRLLAAFVLLLGILQVELLFTGAFQVSMQTNWPRLGLFLSTKIEQAQRGQDEETFKSEKKRATRYINLSTRQSDEERKQAASSSR